MNCKKEHRIRWLWGVLIIVLFIQGCSIPTSDQSDFPFELLMQPYDLPEGWTRAGNDFPEQPGADDRLMYFEGSREQGKEYLLASHELAVYGSESEARESYPAWEDRWFPTETWIRPDEAEFIPLIPEDMNRLACMNVLINENPITSCGYLQQHSNLLSLVLVNIDDDTITLAEFKEALKALDQRFQVYKGKN